jgi:hypothetical protein
MLSKKAEGVQVFVNGRNASAMLGVETPIDLGSYDLIANAPGYRAWHKTVDVTQDHQTIVVDIDLEPLP